MLLKSQLLIKLMVPVLMCLGMVILQPGHAQVTGVKYKLEYNAVTDEFDAYIFIVSGSATTIPRRTLTNTQYTLVTPAGSNVEIVRSYMPVRNNQNYLGTEPAPWSITTSVLNPAITPHLDYHSVTPSLAVASQFNNLSAGMLIKIFSFRVSINNGCLIDVRNFINGFDPNSGAPGMGGGDYSNGFTIGGPAQRYQGNLPSGFQGIAGSGLSLTIGRSVTVTASQGGTGTWSVWTQRPGLSIVNTAPGTAVVTALDNATDQYILRYTDGVYSEFICVNVSDLRLGITGNSLICNDQSAIIRAIVEEPVSYLWSNGSTSHFIMTDLPGRYSVTVTNNAGFQASASFDVKKSFELLLPKDTFCINETFFLPDSIPGNWSSIHPEVISVTNNHLATCLQPGKTQFIFVYANENCVVRSNTIFVKEKPIVYLSGDINNVNPLVTLCENEQTRIFPSSGGYWTSQKESVIHVTQDGLVTGVNEGTTYLYFTENMHGCISDFYEGIVLGKPNVKNLGRDTICLYQNTQLYPSNNGFWTALHPDIADCTPQGSVIGLTSGIAVFEYMSDTMECLGYLKIVVDKPSPAISNDIIQVNENILLYPVSGGEWISLNPSLISITNNAFATGLFPGHTSLRFNSFTGCVAEFPVEVLGSRMYHGNDISHQVKHAFEIFTNQKNQEVYSSSFLKIYPNPASEYLYFETSGKEESIVIFDQTGKEVMESTFDKNKIDIKHLRPGHYILGVLHNDIWSFEKFVVE